MVTENNNEQVEEKKENEVNTDEVLKGAIEEILSKARRQSMLLGFQVSCQAVLDKISEFERKPGSKSNNDHKRLIKDIKNFCEIGVSRKVNTDGETEPIEETAQN